MARIATFKGLFLDKGDITAKFPLRKLDVEI
jgi:hypothetical protein